MRYQPVFLLLVLLTMAPGANAALKIETWQTPNGARVLFVETRQLPMVQLAVGFDAGSARDPEDRQGLAHAVTLLVEEGAGDLSGEDIALALEAVGAEYVSENGRDMAVFELRSLSDPDKLETATRVLAQMLSQPTFPQAALDREKQRLLVHFKQQQQSPREVVARAFYRKLFDGHPYARHPEGNPTGVARIERQDLISFHRRYFVADNAVVALVGDLDRARAERLVDTERGREREVGARAQRERREA